MKNPVCLFQHSLYISIKYLYECAVDTNTNFNVTRERVCLISCARVDLRLSTLVASTILCLLEDWNQSDCFYEKKNKERIWILLGYRLWVVWKHFELFATDISTMLDWWMIAVSFLTWFTLFLAKENISKLEER